MKLYVILIRRPVDSEACPAVYRSYDRAALAYGRISDVVEIEVAEREHAPLAPV